MQLAAFLRPHMARMRPWLSRVIGAFPLRLAGVVLTGVALFLVFSWAPSAVDQVALAAGVAALGLVSLCTLLVVLGAIVLRLRTRVVAEASAVDTHQAMRTGHRFFNLRRWPLVTVRLQWDSPVGVQASLDPDGAGTSSETIIAYARGRYARVVRRLTVEDVFGLAAISFTSTSEAPVRIAPAVASHAAALAIGQRVGDAWSQPATQAEGDLVEMRQYAPGDPLRRVLWKAFARSRRLLVRMPETAVAPQPVRVAYLVAGPGDEASAAVARLYLERGLLGNDFRFWADGAAAPTRVIDEAIEQIVDSAHARQHGGAGLGSLAEQSETLGSCVVFAPAQDGPWSERVLAFGRSLPSPPTIVIGVEDPPAAPLRGWRRFVFAGSRAQHVTWVRDKFERAGLPVQVIHRDSGQSL